MNESGPPLRISDLLIEASLVDSNGFVYGDENYAGPDGFDSVILEEGDIVVGVLYFDPPPFYVPERLRVRLSGGVFLETGLVP
jgi:hypothetical protein